jgi:type I restriction enzyme S subunit
MQQLQKVKKTELGDIPEDWSFKKIKELLDENVILEVQDGNHGELHPKLVDFSEKGIPFLTANCIINNKISFDSCKHLPDIWIKKLRIGFAKENDVILTHKGTLGSCAIVPSGIKNLILSPQTTYYRLSPKISSTFLYYFFQSDYFQKQLFKMGKQSTRDYIGIIAQKSLFLILPSLKEQQKIASILSTVDELVHKTEQIIEQTQRFKKGMMQRLLTKGIRHTKFKKTELGEIPEEWFIANIDQLVKNKTDIKTGPFGSSLKKEIFVEKGYKIYGQENVIPDNFSIGNYFIPESIFLKMKQYEVKPGDILISLVGTHGKISIVPDNIHPGIINPRLLRIRIDNSKVLPEYIISLAAIISSSLFFIGMTCFHFK